MPSESARRNANVDWERLSFLFEATMSLPPTHRRAHLDALRTDEPMLWRELVELVDVADDAGAFFADMSHEIITPVFDAALASVSGDPDGATPAAVQPLTRVRHYEVHECLGAGGMGVVYRGWDTRLARDVALKFVSPDRLIDPSSKQRLLHEAQAASSLSDAHVCAIYSIEDLADGGVCVIMHYCAGGTLRDRLRNGPLEVAEAIRVAAQVAAGLASAHSGGIVHRDIKPANIGFDANGNARILDFGIAARMGTHDAPRGSSLAGSLPYIAPEQLLGADPDERADVWALGVTLHEMLVGRRPFEEQLNVSLAHQIRSAPPAPLVREDGVRVPHALAELVQRLLQKQPSDRPNNGDAVLALLNALEATPAAVPSTSTEAPTSNTPPRSALTRKAPRFFARRGTGVALLFAGAFTMVAAFAWSERQRAAQTDQPADSPLEVARTGAPLPTLAVLPFSVEGSGELEFLRNGLVDLLTSAFDATGLVRGIDPNAVIGSASVPVGVRPDSAAASLVAAQLGASRFVVGNVVGAGTSVTIRATLFRASGEESGRASLVLNNLDELTAAVDRLVYGLIASELRAPGDTVAGLAARTTSSAPALRAYLDGERELRDARPAAALVHFQRAVALDSMFGIAWYRLARAAKWSDVDSLNVMATQRAFALVASLPFRMQDIVRGYHALQFGSQRDAERILERVTRDYPTDVDAWMLLGETRFHQNPYFGRPTDDATAAFRRVMALDPRNREVNVYLMDLAARANRLGELDTLFRMYFSPNSAGEQPGIRQTYIALHARRFDVPDQSVAPAERIQDAAAARIALQRVHGALPDLRAARAYAQILASPLNESAIRVEGLLALATLDLVNGQREAAWSSWGEAASLDAQSTLRHRALLALAPTDLPPLPQLDSLVRQLKAASFVATTGSHDLSAVERDNLRQYLIGVLSARLRDDAGVENARRAIARAVGNSRLAAPLDAALRGHQGLVAGRYEDAVQAFASSVVDVPVGVRRRYPALEQHADRLAHADALRALQRSSDAARWYASLLEGPALTALPYRAAARARLDAVSAGVLR